ncbi:MAG: tellurite resistance-related uncharacterized protein [Candidatus Omnitrophota bacterium]|jgi:tellurite resistance-related uncharacterized protein
MKTLPEGVEVYKQTDVFDQNTVPAGLLKDHNTVEGVWAEIIVIEGELDYIIQSTPPQQYKLNSEQRGIVEPKVLHYVIPSPSVRFYVRFYR